MSNATETKTQAYHQLASYFRRNPDAVNDSSEELAARFSVPASLVEDVQSAIRDRHSRKIGEGLQPGDLVKPTVRMVGEKFLLPVWRQTHRAWCASTAKPAWFVGVTTCIAIAVVFAFRQVHLGHSIDVHLEGIAAALVLVILILQGLCYFRHSMARHALYGGVVNWVIASILAIVSSWVDSRPATPEQNLVQILLFLGILLIVGAVYAAIGVICAVLGGYRQLRRAEVQKENLSRQQLLERMFEIEERLRRGPTGETNFMGLLDQPALQPIRNHPFSAAVIMGLFLGLLYVLPAAWLSLLHGNQEGASGFSIARSAIGGVVAVAWIFAEACIGFLSGRINRTLTACALFAICSGLPMLIPVHGFGPAHFVEVARMLWLPLGMATIAITWVAGAGAAVEERAARERRLRHNDPATLLAEMLDIQYMLTPTTSSVCIMVVDAARSADMKAAADPLIVEYSFREYQRLIGDVSERFGGNVQSTAGDGAVVSFGSCSEAFAAAKRIQTDIEDFNREINRLKSPFRLRIGLHLGKVAGELAKVQFTEVIDIAAHVQAVAPVGGIAMTELVKEQLGGEPVVQLKETVDGHTVMLVLNPTVDQ